MLLTGMNIKHRSETQIEDHLNNEGRYLTVMLNIYYTYIHKYMYVCAYVFIHIHTCTHSHIYVYIYTHNYTINTCSIIING